MRALALGLLIWRVARWLECRHLLPKSASRSWLLVLFFWKISTISLTKGQQKCSVPISQHILSWPRSLNIFVEIKVNKCWLKANSFFWEINQSFSCLKSRSIHTCSLMGGEWVPELGQSAPSVPIFQSSNPKSRPLEGCEYKILGHFTQPFSRYEFLNFGAFRPFQTWQRRGRAREKHETVLV